MNGISVDPVTHALRLPEVLPCSKIEIVEMRALHAMYNTDVLKEATNCIKMLPGVQQGERETLQIRWQANIQLAADERL
ncbi:Hypothetical protein, putative [Bodo saltans]|uniref:Uncharacterized protein n=1 Tax=Bodo saltans TaxID=75058 RepID=A0A0S4JDN5_BODSA|nr:Hypothetical protein, putative [Bodo saltans]|eukprot:CUG88224.1 Hypothetical protein, putative [Bodo saltans]